MTTSTVPGRLARIRVLPVVVLDDPDDALPLAGALSRGGVSCAEITLRTPTALETISRLSDLESFLVGAGTVLETALVDETLARGAAFIVTPGLDPDIVQHTLAKGSVIIPGVATATEVMAARRLGLMTVKLFPAETLGGAGMIQALHGPFPDVTFVPSGGITVDNAATYRHAAVHTVSTSWIAPRNLIAEHRFDEIERRATVFREAVHA